MNNPLVTFARDKISGLIHGSSGYNYDPDIWDEQYATGFWDYFETLNEMPHYLVTAAYARHIQAMPAILDVGCGFGTLVTYLKLFGYSSYLGIDFSPVAIERARSAGYEGETEFEVAGLESWDSNRRFDVIIFSESLYYADSPADALSRYNAFLKQDGAMVVSIFRARNYRKIWKSFESRFSVLHSTRVTNAKNQTSDIKILRPKQA